MNRPTIAALAVGGAVGPTRVHSHKWPTAQESASSWSRKICASQTIHGSAAHSGIHAIRQLSSTMTILFRSIEDSSEVPQVWQHRSVGSWTSHNGSSINYQ